MSDGSTPAGWYPDGQGGERWWDGNQWTDQTRPLTAPPEPPPPPTPPSEPEMPGAQAAPVDRPQTSAEPAPLANEPTRVAPRRQLPPDEPTKVAPPGEPGPLEATRVAPPRDDPAAAPSRPSRPAGPAGRAGPAGPFARAGRAGPTGAVPGRVVGAAAAAPAAAAAAAVPARPPGAGAPGLGRPGQCAGPGRAGLLAVGPGRRAQRRLRWRTARRSCFSPAPRCW